MPSLSSFASIAWRTAAPGLAIAAFAGCASDFGSAEATSSFDLLQREVFNTECVVCHMGGNAYAIESGLELQAGVAHANLVGVPPRDPLAAAAGMLRVAPGDPDRSQLLHKLRWGGSASDPTYGAPMPLGRDPLSQGQVEFIRQWIAAGAPREGTVASPHLLHDRSPQEVATFTPPPPPDRGFQVHIPKFEVQPQSEREFFVYVPLGNTEEIWVNRVEVTMRPNSHHFVVSHYGPNTPPGVIPTPGEKREVWGPGGTYNPSAMAGMSYRTRIAGAQTGESASLFPEGIAIRLPADVWLDLNSHYLNWTREVLNGEVYANLHTVDPATVEHEAHALFLNNGQLNIPPHAPGQTTVQSRNFIFDEDRHVVTLTSHMHEKGVRFVVRKVGADGVPGEIVYETPRWADPDLVQFDPPLEIRAGEGLRAETTYHNPTDSTVRFGLTSRDEMSIILGYFYRP